MQRIKRYKKIIQSYDGFSAKPQFEVSDNAYRQNLVRKDVETALSGSQALASRTLKSLVSKDEIRVLGQGKKMRYEKA